MIIELQSKANILVRKQSFLHDTSSHRQNTFLCKIMLLSLLADSYAVTLLLNLSTSNKLNN